MTGSIAVPVRCAHRPMQGGMVVPWVSGSIDGRLVIPAIDVQRRHECLTRGLCHICGGRLAVPFVVVVQAEHLAARFTDELPMHPECAAYSVRVCPVLNGAMPRYRDGYRWETEPRPGGGAGAVGRFVAVWLRRYTPATSPEGVSGLTWPDEPLRVRPVEPAATPGGAS